MARKVSVRNGRARGTRSPERGKGSKRKKKTEKQPVIAASRADLALVERFKHGDPGAFEAIFETYSGPLLGFLTRMCGHPEDAKEGLQDTVLSVFRYLEGFRGEASLKNWIFKIAVTSCLKKKRKGQELVSTEIAGNRVDRTGSEDTVEPLVAAPGSPGWKLDPEELVLDGEFRGYLIEGVASMPYIYKVVINLRDFEGFSTQEVSRMLGIKEATVKVRLHRARLHLQNWLKRRYQVSGQGVREGS